jgi:hypothetical protein
VSAENVQTLRTLQQKYPQGSVKVASFDAVDVPLRSITCRGAGPVMPPDEKTFEQYVQAALVDDLRMAGVYSDKSKVAVSAKMSMLDFSSTSGAWTLAARVSAGTEAPYLIEHKGTYKSSFMGDNACQLTAQAFMPSVQDFLRKVISSPEFEKAFSASVAAPAPSAEAIPGS